MIIGVNGIQLYYTKTGHGRPLIMLHGNGEDHTIFDEAVGVLKEHFTCYCVDSRGHGQSSPCKELHYKDMAADMIAFMSELDLYDAAFYGFSDGGIAALLAAMDCSRITNLVVSGANITTKGTTLPFRLFLKVSSLGKYDPLIELMKNEPDIPPAELSRIRVKTLVTAGSRDLIRDRQQGSDQGIGDKADCGIDPECETDDPEGGETRQLYRTQYEDRRYFAEGTGVRRELCFLLELRKR